MMETFPAAAIALPPKRSSSAVWIGADARGWAVTAVAIGLYLANIASLFGLTVDDGYIVLRYAHNVVAHGVLDYNLGEHVSALTSPLDSIWFVILDALTGRPELANKLAGAALVLAAMLWSVGSAVETPVSRDLVLLAVLGSPFLALWTVAGLETGLLAATVALLTANYVRSVDGPHAPSQLLPLSLLAGVAFLLRYDSVLFTAPIIAQLMLQRRRFGLVYLAPAAALVLLFLGLWYRGFEAVLPTSFYVKAPTGEGSVLRAGLTYEISYFVLCLGVLWIGWNISWATAARLAIRRYPGASIGLGLIAAYGLGAGTVHMMFAYRLMTPYIAAYAIWLGCLAVPARLGSIGRLALAAMLPPALLGIIWTVSLNPSLYDLAWSRWRHLPAPVEYARLPLPFYLDYMEALRLDAGDIAADWHERGLPGNPVLTTIAGGATPYLLSDAYAYEQLVSFRRHCPGTGLHGTVLAYAAAANYIQIQVPTFGTIEEQVGPDLAPRLELISLRSFRFVIHEPAPIDSRMLVFWNPHPKPMHLPATLDGDCSSLGGG